MGLIVAREYRGFFTFISDVLALINRIWLYKIQLSPAEASSNLLFLLTTRVHHCRSSVSLNIFLFYFWLYDML